MTIFHIYYLIFVSLGHPPAGHCGTDCECPDWARCLHSPGVCLDPCLGAAVCGDHANCQVSAGTRVRSREVTDEVPVQTRGHVAVCACGPGWSGEATRGCYPLPTPPCPWYLDCADGEQE